MTRRVDLDEVLSRDPWPLRDCRACGSYAPQIHAGQPTERGRCTHVAFDKSGWARVDRVGAAPDRVGASRSHRPDADARAALRRDGYHVADLTEVKARRAACGHWTHPAGQAATLSAGYGDDLSAVVSGLPRRVPAALADFVRDGCPTTAAAFDPLHRAHGEATIVGRVPDRKLKYGTCGSCACYVPGVWSADDCAPGGSPDAGAPTPGRGRCTIDAGAGGLFAPGDGPETGSGEVDGEFDDGTDNLEAAPDAGSAGAAPASPVTYAFMGCVDWHPRPDLDLSEPISALPPKLMPFVDVVDLDLSFDEIRAIYRSPQIVRLSRPGADADHARAVGADLMGDLRARHREVDRDALSADFRTRPVADYFARGLAAGERAARARWAPMRHYGAAEHALYGPATPGANPDSVPATPGTESVDG